MKTSLGRTRQLGHIALVAALLTANVDAATPVPENEALIAPAAAADKLKQLRLRIKQLESDVGELQPLSRAVDVAVDCSAGGSIGNVLATHANGLGQLTIRVTGTCIEAVTITRSNVVLLGSGPATIQAPAPTAFALLVTRARNVEVANLRLAGGQGAAGVTKNAQAIFSGVLAEGSNLGMVSADNGTMEITRSTLRGNSFGAYSIRRGVTLISDSIIENNTTGILAFKGGTINVTSLAPDATTIAAGVIVRNNGTGGVSRSGGLIDLSDARFEGNRSVGLLVDSTSALHFFSSINGSANRISGNGSVGVLVQKNSSVVFTDATNVITGNGTGILCQPDSSYLISAGSPGNVTGNVSGDIVGCVP